MYILDYNENSTAQYMYKQAVLHTTSLVHSSHDGRPGKAHTR